MEEQVNDRHETEEESEGYDKITCFCPICDAGNIRYAKTGYMYVCINCWHEWD